MTRKRINLALGFDFGMKYIGYAVGQTITQGSRPLGIIKAKQGKPDWHAVSKIIGQWQPQALIVGIPFGMVPDEGNDIEAFAKKFANQLGERYQLPVYTIDERLSSRAAWEQLTEEGRHPDKATVDATAAQIILQSWLNEYCA
ncbi:MAG: Holliday junction resolvase RuvX [Pseudomonadota bacterium]